MAVETSEAIVVLVTAASDEDATRLAEMLVRTKLAACVQILPGMKSVYLWRDGVERQSEVLLIAKTLRSKFEELDRKVRDMHQYEVPEIAAVPVSAISGPYLNWLIETIESSPKAEQNDH